MIDLESKKNLSILQIANKEPDDPADELISLNKNLVSDERQSQMAVTKALSTVKLVKVVTLQAQMEQTKVYMKITLKIISR